MHAGSPSRWAAADAAALRLQVLQEDGRQRALSHVGISSSVTAPDGARWVCRRTNNLVQDWASTCRTVLTQQHIKVCMPSGHCLVVNCWKAAVHQLAA